eukprot:NODE_153_length_15389_cov_1.201439.p1 type:complete len:948 gc:universal NODE_153_length_15389_cov_1.201439:12079-14922(+)
MLIQIQPAHYSIQNDEVIFEIRLLKLLNLYNDITVSRDLIECDQLHELLGRLKEHDFEYNTIEVIKLRIFGMTCTSCSGAIEENVGIMEGIYNCVVNLALEYCIVKFNKKIIGVRDIITRIEELGFDVLMMDMSASIQLEHLQKTKDIIELRSAFQKSLIFSIPNMLLMFINNGPELYHIYVTHFIQFILATISMCTVGKRFYYHAYKGLLNNSFTMDTLVSLGTLSAYLFSVIMMIHRISHSDEHLIVFFDTTTMLITFILLGKFLETSAKAKTSTALGNLLQLRPENATLVEWNEKGKLMNFDYKPDFNYWFNIWEMCSIDQLVHKQKSISTDLIQNGDIICVLAGERIPADGFVIHGNTSVDESLITGETLPIEKNIGDHVIAGSINGNGVFRMYADAVGNDTTLSRIIHLVEKAQSVKAPIEYVSDAIASIFVPVVVSLAILTFISWYIILSVFTPADSFFEHLGTHGRADTLFLCVKICISVVVIACPCTLGLATPTAVMVGTGVSANLGILIKGGSSLEGANNITTLVFDKTGTLTSGKMSVQRSFILENKDKISERLFWTLLAAAELNSEHPIGRSIVEYSRKCLNLARNQIRQVVNSTKVDILPGLGIKLICKVDSNYSNPSSPLNSPKISKKADTAFSDHHGEHFEVLVGNAKLMKKSGIDGSLLQSFFEDESMLGHTVIFVALNNKLAGCVSVGDELKPFARETVEGLEMMGIEVIMCTGDNSITANAVASKCGITEVFAEVSPQGKAQIIKEIKSRKSYRKISYFDKFLNRFRQDVDDRQVVGFCGDGINDSIALAESDIGISLGSGSDIAMETADIILMKSELLDVVTSIDLSRNIFKRIKLNFLWAFSYNMVSIPLAMGVGIPFGLFLHPMTAGAAMAFSSVSVVTSSLMLKFYKVPTWILKLKGEIVHYYLLERTVMKFNGLFSNNSEYYPLQ